VALAHRFGLCLVYEPIVCGHGLGDAFEQLLWGAAEDVADGIVPPFCAPHIQVSTDGRTVTAGGRAINRVVLEGRRPDSKDLSNELIAKTLSTVSPGSLVLLLKAQAYKSMRMTERMGAECSKSPRAYYYSGLWLRERYWRAVHRMHERSPRWEESRTLHKPPSLLATALAKVRAKMGSLGRQDSSRAARLSCRCRIVDGADMRSRTSRRPHEDDGGLARDPSGMDGPSHRACFPAGDQCRHRAPSACATRRGHHPH
jgi:hypothetical protein